MPTQQELINEILTTIDDAVNAFNENIPQIQKDILSDIILLTKELDTDKNGGIKNTVKNLKLIGQIKSKIENIILNERYLKNVSDFTNSFDEISKLQNSYFLLLEKTFTPSGLLNEIQKQAVNSTIFSLTEAGIAANVTEEVEAMLLVNVTSGGTYSDLISQLRESIISNKSGQGLLERYTKQVTVDAIQQFNAQYSHAIADDLNLTWYLYVGSNIDTTREFCEFLTKKKYINKKELPTILQGNIDGHQCKINPKTDLWQGAVPDTNVSNFPIYRGGFNCQHQLTPVSSAVVPAAIRAKFPD